MTKRVMKELSRDECLELLHQTGIGRLAFCDELGPVALPVNYALAGDDIVFRREASTPPSSFEGSFVGFEIDGFDAELDQGWSVLVRGRVHRVDLDDVPTLLRSLKQGPPHPWADGVHNVWFRLVTEVVTGRRLGAVATPLVM